MKIEPYELELIVSNCLNDSNVWRMLEHSLKRRYNIDMGSDELHILACDVENMIAEQIINYDPNE